MEAKHEIITREQAFELGLKKYYSGNACKKGHVGLRWVTSNICVDCIREWMRRNKVKVNKRSNAWQKANRAHMRAYHKKWRELNKERWRELMLRSNAKRRAKRNQNA